MKNLYYKLFLGGLVVLSASCKRTLEPEPLELQSPDYVWDTQDSAGVNAGRVLVDVYSAIPNGHNRIQSLSGSDNGSDFLDAATDDAVSSGIGLTPVGTIATGQGITPFVNNEGGNSWGVVDMWGNNYRGIRKATIFINNIDKVPLAGTISGNRPLREAWKAEAKFLRALYYFELVKRYGGVPLMGDAVRQITDDVLLPRNSYEECIEYIVSQCDTITQHLRHDFVDNNDVDYGRATRGAAMALKTRVLLYAASPLYNQFNTGTSEAQKRVAGYPSYDINRWKRAADAAADIIKLNVFQLYPSFKDVFITPTSGNREVMFLRNNGASTNLETSNGPVGFTGNAQGNGRTSPTQEFVDAFPMINGKAINEPGSGYDPIVPYANRDPRLDATVLHNGSQWLNTTIETFEGGRNKPGGSRIQTKTSYYLRKFMGNFEAQANYSATSHNFIMFRFAEVLLNFAEATNEYQGNKEPVYRALIELRRRAGIQEGDGYYGLARDLNTEELRKVIQNERRIELAFEEHRYWDIRRWKIAEELNGKTIHGLSFGKSTGYQSAIRNEVQTMVFDKSKMYLYPISQSEIDKNKNLIQNPGW